MLPLFAAADGESLPRPEVVEPAVVLVPMREGRGLAEDDRNIGLTLGRHPVALVRPELRARGMVACAELTGATAGEVVVAGVVLVW